MGKLIKEVLETTTLFYFICLAITPIATVLIIMKIYKWFRYWGYAILIPLTIGTIIMGWMKWRR